MAVDLTGKWSFNENFSFGMDEGIAELYQKDNKVSGILEFTETIEGEAPFDVHCELMGSIDGAKVVFKVINFKIVSASEPIEYYPEIREGILNANGQIVGSSEDEQGVCGVFVFEKIL